MSGFEILIAALIYLFFIWMFYCLDKTQDEEDDDERDYDED